MAITRWDPMRDFEDMQRRFFGGSFLKDFNQGNEALQRAEWAPAVDIAETNEAYTLHAEVPGFKKEDIKLTVEDGVLTLAGERKFETEEKNKKYHRVERSYGRFQRSFTLPNAVDEAKVVATYNNGVLDVMIPKAAPPPPKTKEIKIG
jgi:HSP20 family protein